jgi:hypothetical protein
VSVRGNLTSSNARPCTKRQGNSVSFSMVASRTHFRWLFRDIRLPPVHRSGQILSPYGKLFPCLRRSQRDPANKPLKVRCVGLGPIYAHGWKTVLGKAREMDHIKPLRLFDLSQAEKRENGFQLNKEERQHLHECEECQQVLLVFARQFSKKRPPYDRPEDAA